MTGSRSFSKPTSANSSDSTADGEVPHRSVSVSEMIRNFGTPSRTSPHPTPPAKAPKPRYSHLPAHRPETAQSPPKVFHFERCRGNSIPSDMPSQLTKLEDHTRNSPLQQQRRASVAVSSNFPVPVDDPRDIIDRSRPAGGSAAPPPTKPVPMFRTAVHGLHLGALGRTSQEKLKEDTVLEEEPAAGPAAVAATVVNFEDRGYGSGEIHLPSEALLMGSTSAAVQGSSLIKIDHRNSVAESSVSEEDSAKIENSADTSDLLHVKVFVLFSSPNFFFLNQDKEESENKTKMMSTDGLEKI